MERRSSIRPPPGCLVRSRELEALRGWAWLLPKRYILLQPFAVVPNLIYWSGSRGPRFLWAICGGLQNGSTNAGSSHQG